MDNKGLLDAAKDSLDRVLGFFARVEAKINALFAVDAAMLGLLALNLTAADLKTWYVIVPSVVAVGVLVAAIYFLYHASFPQLSGGAKSLVYFREIAALREADFIKQMEDIKIDDYARDMLGQVWRNSEILKLKFEHLKRAFNLIAFAIPVWFLALVVAALDHAKLVVK